MGSALPKLQVPNENCLSKSPTIEKSCVSERARAALSRPLTLTLKKTEKYKLSLNNKANQSLPESPVCEELKLLKEQCKREVSRFARFAQKRRSCSYFIGLNENVEDIAKSFESLPAMNERNMENRKENMDDVDDVEGNGNFSDDSLEGDFKNPPPPRRCVSDYQINVRMDDHRNNYLSNCQGLQRRILTGSQESVLSDASVESFSKGSAEILDYNHYDHDRHSSASFFLSRRRMQAGRSQESVLTDESDYQMFPLRENADHRSTESVLTDDSDSLVKSAPLEMLFDSHYKTRKRQNSETYSGYPGNAVETVTDNDRGPVDAENALRRAVFRSKSLQDTRITRARNDVNFAEDNAPAKTHLYYEFNLDCERKDNNDASICEKSEKLFTTARSNSLQVPMTPITPMTESLTILNDFVAHKPPKPKRNSSRTQSMRNRSRPSWKYMDAPLSSAVKTTTVVDPDVLPSAYYNPAYLEYRIARSDLGAKRDSTDSEAIEFLQSTVHYPIERSNDDKDRDKFYSLQPHHRADSNVNLREMTTPMYDNDDSSQRDATKSRHYRSEEQRSPATADEERMHYFEKEIPTKDTGETYDSLEPGGTLCDPLQKTTEPPTADSSLRSTNERIASLDASVDVRITRAIEGTVKLLSKEFENLVRRKEYFMKEKCLRLAHCDQETNEASNFAKLEAERDGRCCAIRRDARLQSAGEDSDCADVSAMDRSLMESGSSTSASSCTNSPKRMWPPASRCHSHMKWMKTLPTIDQAILPTKHPYAGIDRVGNASSSFVLFPFLYI